MLTNSDRRSFLKSAAIVTASGFLATHARGDEKAAPTLNAGPSPDPGKPKRVVAPPKACDCHAHIIGPVAKYPFVAGRSFTPVEAHLDQYRRMLSALGLQRAAALAALDDAGFRARFAGSPVKRIGRDRFLRNVLIAIGNSADHSLLPAAAAHLDAPNPVVAEAATWAVARLASA